MDKHTQHSKVFVDLAVRAYIAWLDADPYRGDEAEREDLNALVSRLSRPEMVDYVARTEGIDERRGSLRFGG